MKPTLLFATLSMVFASPSVFAKSELETLRAKCAAQERQIQQLQQDNSKLRPTAPHSLGSQTELVSTAASKPTAAPSSSTYTVKSGDSFEKIARKVGVSATKLAKSNGMKTNSIIHPGQTLKVPGTAIAAASTPAPSASPKVSAPSPAISGKSYTVRQGETFASIGRKNRLSVAALVAANPSVKPTALRPGQVISLGAEKAPAAVASAPAPKAPAPTPAPEKPASMIAEKAPAHPTTMSILASKAPAPVPAPFAKTSTPPPTTATPPPSVPVAAAAQTAKTETPPTERLAAAEETLSPNPEKKIRPITIDGEMTYGEFATKHGTNAERLNALNGLDLNNTTVLAKGSELYVPAQP